MTHALRSDLARLSSVVSIAGSAGSICVFSACSASRSTDRETRSVRATEHIDAPIRRLQAQAELEAINPALAIDESIVRVFVPDGLDPLTPGSPAHQRAMQPLDQVLASIPKRKHPVASENASPEHIQQATKLYANARAALSTGDLESAIDLLSRASVLDPSSAKLLNALGDAYMDQGDRMSAIGAYEQAAELGGASSRALILLATESANARNTEKALQLAIESQSADVDDPMAGTIGNVLIGGILIEDGHLLAGATALSDALTNFDISSRDPRWRTEIIQMHAQYQTLWMRVGDAWTALNAPARARDAYTRAALPDQPIPFPLVARRIASDLRDGQPASAALSFLDHIHSAPANTSSDEKQWAAALSSIDALGAIIPRAIRELRTQRERTISEQRALLRIELVALSNKDRVDAIAEIDPEIASSLVAAEALADIADDNDRYRACVEILRVNPEIAPSIAGALGRSLDEPFVFLQNHADVRDSAQRLLIANLAIELGRADVLAAPDEIATDAPVAALVAETQIAALNGRWADADRLIARLETLDSPNAIRGLSRALLIAQQSTRAWETISEFADYSDASTMDLQAAANIALAMNNAEAARSFLERALEQDPNLEEVYEQLLVMHSPGAALADEEEHRRLVRQLSVTLPRSDLFTLVRANDLARSGLLRDAESLLVNLAQRSPHRDVGIQLLNGIWGSLSEAGDFGAIDRGKKWLNAHLRSIPSSNAARIALARLLVRDGNPDDAIKILDEGYRAIGSFELARASESILSSELDNPIESQNRALARTENQMAIDLRLERAGLLARSDRDDDAIEIVRDIPTSIELMSAQQNQLARVLFDLAVREDVISPSETWIALYDRCRSWMDPAPLQLLRVRLMMLAELRPSEHDQLTIATIETLNALDDSTPEAQRNAVEILTVQQLLANERRHDALAVLHKLATRDHGLDDRLAVEILRLSAGLGDAADVTRVIDRLARDGYLARMIAIADEQLGLPSRDRPSDSEDALRADVAYTIASIAQAFARDDATIDALFELALSYDDTHPWANNDYGYMLIERANNDRIEDGERLLIKAHAFLPDDASVLDSLGWARYKLSILEDTKEKEGAVTLLQRAVEAQSKDENDGNATIHDHLGDTYWRLGRFEDAMEEWLTAEQLLRKQIQSATALEDVNQSALERLSEALRTIRLKLSDAESGQIPAIGQIPDIYEAIPARPMIGVDPTK